jgi:hypothetical protein
MARGSWPMHWRPGWSSSPFEPAKKKQKAEMQGLRDHGLRDHRPQTTDHRPRTTDHEPRTTGNGGRDEEGKCRNPKECPALSVFIGVHLWFRRVCYMLALCAMPPPCSGRSWGHWVRLDYYPSELGQLGQRLGASPKCVHLRLHRVLRNGNIGLFNEVRAVYSPMRVVTHGNQQTAPRKLGIPAG